MKFIYFLAGAVNFAKFLAMMGHQEGWWMAGQAMNIQPAETIMLYGVCAILFFDIWRREDEKEETRS